MRMKLALAALLAAGGAFTATPASAVCTFEPDPVFGWCNTCQPVGFVYGTANHALSDKLPQLDCPA